MAARRIFGCLLAICVWTGGKDKGDATTGAGSAVATTKECETLAKACGDTPKHIEKLTAECSVAAAKKNACADKLQALIACYEKDVCGAGDKVWTIEDLRVLAERHQKCATERAAIAGCGK